MNFSEVYKKIEVFPNSSKAYKLLPSPYVYEDCSYKLQGQYIVIHVETLKKIEAHVHDLEQVRQYRITK